MSKAQEKIEIKCGKSGKLYSQLGSKKKRLPWDCQAAQGLRTAACSAQHPASNEYSRNTSYVGGVLNDCAYRLLNC